MAIEKYFFALGSVKVGRRNFTKVYQIVMLMMAKLEDFRCTPEIVRMWMGLGTKPRFAMSSVK